MNLIYVVVASTLSAVASYAVAFKRGGRAGRSQTQAEAVWMLEHGALAGRWLS